MLRRINFRFFQGISFYFTATCLMISLALILLSRNAEGFAQWYVVNLYPLLPNTVARAFSVWNRSFFETGILVAILLAVLLIMTGIGLIFFNRTLWKRYGIQSARTIICIMSFLLLVYTITCGINYHRDDIGTILKLPDTAATKDNLTKLCYLLTKELTELTNDPEWDYRLLTEESEEYIETEAIVAMKQLGDNEPSLAGYYPKPKPLVFSKFMSSLGIEGIYSPFTMEANYNNDMTSFLVPYTICHELAHLKGYMKENDAGFIAYLACKNSPSKVFQYSGIFHALIYSLNALKSEATPEEFIAVYLTLPEPVRLQLSYIKEQSNINESQVTSIAKSANNMYLRANAQSGTKSYGRIVDLLLSDYYDRIAKETLL